jgi:hypothetical protein
VAARLIPRERLALGFDIIMIFRYVISGSLALVSMYLTCPDLRPGFSSTLTTKALYLSSLRWFGTGSYQPIPVE